MAGKKENIKALFTNTRSRVIILFTFILLLIAAIIGIIKFTGSTGSPFVSGADVRRTPVGIRSIPGALNQTAQYASLQEEQNLEQAQSASTTGGSAIPTIIRSQVFGEGVEPVGAAAGQGGLGFQALAREDLAGAQKSLWVQALQDSNCTRASVAKVVTQGASLIDLKSACTCLQLKNNGYKLADLMVVCKCSELKAAGYNIYQMKSAGFTAAQLRTCGYVACEEHGVGFSAQEMKDAGYSDGELKGAGFSDHDIARAGGLPDGYSADDVRKAGCDVAALIRLRSAGVTAAAIRRISGCSADKLKAAGFSAQDLKNAGFSAAELKNAGFTAAQLRDAGFGARDLLNAGFSSGDLADAGFAATEIRDAERILPVGMTADQVKKAGCSVEAIKRQRLAGVSAALIHKYAGCSPQALKAAGFTTKDLLSAGFSPEQMSAGAPVLGDSRISAAGCDPVKLHNLLVQGISAKRIHELNGCSAQALKNAGFDAKDLLDAGFTPEQLAAVGFTPTQLRAAQSVNDAMIRASGCDPAKLKLLLIQGVSAKRIHQLNGCSAQALKNAGFSAKELADAGFSPQELLTAGFTAAEVQATQAPDDKAIREAGCDPVKLNGLMMRGVSAKRIHDMNGCSADALKKAGFDVKALADAGFNPQQLLAAGFTPEEISTTQAVNDKMVQSAGCDPAKLRVLMSRGVSAKRIHALNGCSADALKQAGFSASELLNAGFSPQQLLAAGFKPEDLPATTSLVDDNTIRKAGCDPAQLRKLAAQGVTAQQIHTLNGCSLDVLKAAGFDAKALADAGFTPAQLLAAGFTPEQLINAGLSPAGIIAAGRTADCSVASLQAARALGVSAATIKKTLGCSAQAMKNAGFTALELKNAGFTAAELKNAGFSAGDLKNAGFSAKELRAAGFTGKQLRDAGYNAQQLKDAGFSAAELNDAGFSAAQLKAAGFSAAELKAAGFSAADLIKAGMSASDLKAAGFTADQLKSAGLFDKELQAAGFSSQESALAGLSAVDVKPTISSSVTSIPSIGGVSSTKASADAANAKQLQVILNKQQTQAAAQRYQQKIQQRSSVMTSAANQAVQGWKAVPSQQYVATSVKEKKAAAGGVNAQGAFGLAQNGLVGGGLANGKESVAIVRTGDVLFAVIDTSINSDEPGPILATIVSGKLKGSKLIGSFNLPSNADQMVISFNTLSVPGAAKTVSISAYAIDPNTARTALSSQTDHHYLMRYGSLFASTFLEGFGNAFQSANTTITVGGVGGTTDTTVSNGIGRSTLENAVIGLATLGKAWGQVAMQQMSRPTTVEVFSGTGVGVLFTQDLRAI